MTDTCRKVNEEIWAGIISPQSSEHIDNCMDCAQACREASVILGAMRIELPVAPDCRGVVRSRIESFQGRLWFTRLSFGALAAVAIIAIAFSGKPMTERTGSHPVREDSPSHTTVTVKPDPPSPEADIKVKVQRKSEVRIFSKSASSHRLIHKQESPALETPEKEPITSDSPVVVVLENQAVQTPAPAPILGSVVYSSNTEPKQSFDYISENGTQPYLYTGVRIGDSISVDIQPVHNQIHPEGDDNEHDSPDA